MSLPSSSDVDDLATSILGDTPAIRLVREQIRSVARFADVSVLVLGETGTGKELVAEAIHRLTPSAGTAPFIAINCAAIPESLFESEVFGHEAGSYTGARGVRLGLLEAAAGGTVFLDEIGEMSATLQPKLLRVLETRAFRRVGSNQWLPLSARVVAATNRRVLTEQSLRTDLRYRLAGFTINLPPLRERLADVDTLAREFLRSFAERHQLREARISPDALDALRQQPWPGNVRELRAVVEHAAIASHTGNVGLDDVATALYRSPSRPSNVVSPPSDARHFVVRNPEPRRDSTPSPGATLNFARVALRDVEREAIRQALAANAGNLSRTARQLRIARSTLREKLRKYGLQ